MLLRSSSTPVLGSLFSSWSDTPNRDFDNKHSSSAPDHHHKKISFLHSGHSNFSSYSCNSSPISTPSNTKSLGGFRRAQSDGNLEGLIAAAAASDLDDFHSSKPVSQSLRKPRHSMLQTIPSFSIYNSTNEFEEEEEEEEEGWGGDYSDNDGLLKRSITIGENINGVGSGHFSFGNNMNLIVEEEGVSEFHEEGEPKSPPLYFARGLGLDVGFGGGEDGGAGDFGLPEYGEGDSEKSNMEDFYKKMVEENPGSPLFLRNYAQFLYQSKRDLPRAEEYYSRAILSEPGDGDMLSQYAKIVWELHHDHERASSYFERAVQVAPEDSHVHAAYASFLWETEDEDSFQQDLGGIPVFESRVMATASASLSQETSTYLAISTASLLGT